MKYVLFKKCLVITTILLLTAASFTVNADKRSTGMQSNDPIINPNPYPDPEPIPTTWEKVYPHTKTQDTRDICVTLNGTGIVATGRTYSATVQKQPFLFKATTKGPELWYYEYGPWSLYDAAWCLTRTSDGGFVMGGKVQHNYGGDADDILVFKTNANGTLLWKEEHDIQGHFDRMWDIQELDNGNLVGCGTISPTSPTYHDAGLIKMNSQGQILWYRSFGPSGTTEVARALTATSDGGFLIGGYYGYDQANLKNQLYVVKTDANGNEEWNKILGDANVWSEADWVGETPCGNYIVAGRTGEAYYGTDGWVLKLSAAGHIIWERVIGGNYNSWFRGGIIQENGNFILVGLTQSYSSDPGPNTSNRDGWIMGFHKEGHTLWQKVYGNSGVEEQFSEVDGPTSDGKYVAGGLSGGNIYLVKFALPQQNQVDNLDTGMSYTTIQAAVNAANPGDTLSVHNGTYQENVTIDKSLTIIGENKDDTIILGSDTGDAILITAGNVTIKGFTIKIDYDTYSYGPPYAGIKIVSPSQHNIIDGNNIRDCYRGFFLEGGADTGNVIANNIITNDVTGYLVMDYYSFWIMGSSGNKIYGNTISSTDNQNGYGILLSGSSDNAIYANDINGNYYGIYLMSSSNDNILHHNNFDNVFADAYIENFLGTCTGNQWYLDIEVDPGGNYWSGFSCTDLNGDGVCDEAYSIPGGGTGDQDLYPLSGQWSSLCGNVNGDPQYEVNEPDIDYLIDYMFSGGPEPVPPCAADVNGDGSVDISDAVYLINYLYHGGPPPVQNCCCQ
ncbi:MAG: NosD domain-containing protein [Candidatus Aminicenantes bacterium]|jgi:parallel beta-helix repeat protein